jgi:hypothetical protein
MNTYQYVLGNPFRYTDRLGLDPGKGGQCTPGSSDPLCVAGSDGGNGGIPPPSWNVTLTLGGTVEDGTKGQSQDWGGGFDSAGHLCYVTDVCTASDSGFGMLVDGGLNLGANNGTFDNGSSTSYSTEASIDIGVIDSGGFSLQVGPQPNYEPTGGGFGFWGGGLGGGAMIWTCKTHSVCWSLF